MPPMSKPTDAPLTRDISLLELLRYSAEAAPAPFAIGLTDHVRPNSAPLSAPELLAIIEEVLTIAAEHDSGDDVSNMDGKNSSPNNHRTTQ